MEKFLLFKKKIFAFGGARSHDISDGILNPDDYKPGEFRKVYNDWWDAGKMFRVKNISWWEREMPIPEEMGNGLNNLDECRNNVDFIISHCGPASTVALFSAGTFKPDTLTKYFEEIRQRVKYKKWIFGHYHMNKNVTDKDICIYEQIIRIV